jgi:hypothetical protein
MSDEEKTEHEQEMEAAAPPPTRTPSNPDEHRLAEEADQDRDEPD